MTDLISRQALKNALTDWQMQYAEKGKDVERFETLGAVIDLVEKMSTAEPKHGKWDHHIGIGNVALMKCGECGFTYPELLGMMLFNYCPNCGAKMEGSEDGKA